MRVWTQFAVEDVLGRTTRRSPSTMRAPSRGSGRVKSPRYRGESYRGSIDELAIYEIAHHHAIGAGE